MIKKECDFPGCTDGQNGKPKVIEGYTESHVNSMMRQHKFKHQNQKKKISERRKK